VELENLVSERTAELREREEVLRRSPVLRQDAIKWSTTTAKVTFWNKAGGKNVRL